MAQVEFTLFDTPLGPAAVREAIEGITALFGGSRVELAGVALDTASVPEFDLRVYEQARRIPFGQTTTYGAIAKALGEEPMRARDVGEALARNPFAPIVPCHRVVAAGGRLGGYSGGLDVKRWLLAHEAGHAPALRAS